MITPQDFSKVMHDLKNVSFISDLEVLTQRSLDYSNFTQEKKDIIMNEINKKRLEIASTKPQDRVPATHQDVAEQGRANALQNNQSILLNLNDRFMLAGDLYLDFRDPKLKKLLQQSKSGDSFIVGRRAESSSAHIQIDDPKGIISRHHLVIENIDGKFYATNLGSTNGTTLNNTMLRDISALKGAVIRESVVNSKDVFEDI